MEKLKKLTKGEGFRSGRVQKVKKRRKETSSINMECFSRFLDS